MDGDDDVIMGGGDDEEDEEDEELEEEDEESSEDGDERETIGEYCQWRERADGWFSGSLRLGYPAGRSNGGVLQLWLGKTGTSCFNISSEEDRQRMVGHVDPGPHRSMWAPDRVRSNN